MTESQNYIFKFGNNIARRYWQFEIGEFSCDFCYKTAQKYHEGQIIAERVCGSILMDLRNRFEEWKTQSVLRYTEYTFEYLNVWNHQMYWFELVWWKSA